MDPEMQLFFVEGVDYEYSLMWFIVSKDVVERRERRYNLGYKIQGSDFKLKHKDDEQSIEEITVSIIDRYVYCKIQLCNLYISKYVFRLKQLRFPLLVISNCCKISLTSTLNKVPNILYTNNIAQSYQSIENKAILFEITNDQESDKDQVGQADSVHIKNINYKQQHDINLDKVFSFEKRNLCFILVLCR